MLSFQTWPRNAFLVWLDYETVPLGCAPRVARYDLDAGLYLTCVDHLHALGCYTNPSKVQTVAKLFCSYTGDIQLLIKDVVFAMHSYQRIFYGALSLFRNHYDDSQCRCQPSSIALQKRTAPHIRFL